MTNLLFWRRFFFSCRYRQHQLGRYGCQGHYTKSSNLCRVQTAKGEESFQQTNLIAISCCGMFMTTTLMITTGPSHSNTVKVHTEEPLCVSPAWGRMRYANCEGMKNSNNVGGNNEEQKEKEQCNSSKEQEAGPGGVCGFRRRRLSTILSETLGPSFSRSTHDSASSDESKNESDENSNKSLKNEKEEHKQDQEHQRLGHVIRRQSTRASPATTYGSSNIGSSGKKQGQNSDEQNSSLQKRITAAAALSKTFYRDTFLYAKEIENLNQENPLQTVRSANNNDSDDDDDNEQKQGLERRSLPSNSSPKRTPFPSNVVGTFSCHGIEPLPIRRLLTPIELQFYLLTASITSKSLVHAKINQDRGVVAHPYGNDPNMALFGVFDGHGLHGDDVAHYAMKETLRRLKHHPRFPTKKHASGTSSGILSSNASTKNNNISTSNHHRQGGKYDDLAHAFCDTFHQMDQDLYCQQKSARAENDGSVIDDLFSGTTACVVLVDGTTRTLYIANIGDSRAVLATPSSTPEQHKQQRHYAIELTQDQYPNLPGEKQRLEAYGGYISELDGSCGRVWNRPPTQYKMEDDKTEYDGGHHEPMYGLAMSRSIGDHFLERVGVISTPVVTAHQIPLSPSKLKTKQHSATTPFYDDPSSNSSFDEDNDDVFLILASDGVWSVLKSDEAVDIVSEALSKHEQNASVACEILIETAMEQWRAVEGEYRDDITAVVVRLNELFP